MRVAAFYAFNSRTHAKKARDGCPERGVAHSVAQFFNRILAPLPKYWYSHPKRGAKSPEKGRKGRFCDLFVVEHTGFEPGLRGT